MKIKYIIALSVVLTGCANVQPPLDVSSIPNDCANQHAIIRYLDKVANTPRQTLESQEDYENSRRSYRARAWHVRAKCNPT